MRRLRAGSCDRPAHASGPGRRRLARLAVLAGLLTLLTGCGLGTAPPGAGTGPAATTGPGAAGSRAVPRPRHVVVVIFENRAYGQIIGNPQAGYLNRLARSGALFTASYGVTHPSQPNYLALYSGGTHGITGDQCLAHPLSAPSLGSELAAAGLTFTGFAESLPGGGARICDQGNYARKHVPWSDFSDIPPAASKPMPAFPRQNYARLPTVSFVIPNLCSDMHDCSVATGDAWLRANLGGYARWAMSHDSLLIVTFDEDDSMHHNRIATIFVGQQVRPGRYSRSITHYNVLRTIEQAYGLRYLGRSAAAYPISWIWRSATPAS